MLYFVICSSLYMYIYTYIFLTFWETDEIYDSFSFKVYIHICTQSFHTQFQKFRLRISATAAAKLLQSCPTLCDPVDGSPPGSPVPGILQARVLEWVAISFSNA